MSNLLGTVVTEVKKHWRRPWMRWVAPVAVGAAIAIQNVNRETGAVPLVATIGALFAVVGMRVFWHFSTRVPKVPPRTVGIVVALRAETAEQAQQLRTDFIQHLRRLIEVDAVRTGFHLLELPTWAAEACSDTANATQTLRASSGHTVSG